MCYLRASGSWHKLSEEGILSSRSGGPGGPASYSCLHGQKTEGGGCPTELSKTNSSLPLRLQQKVICTQPRGAVPSRTPCWVSPPRRTGRYVSSLRTTHCLHQTLSNSPSNRPLARPGQHQLPWPGTGTTFLRVPSHNGTRE